MRSLVKAVLCAFMALPIAVVAAETAKPPKQDPAVERGHYLVKIAGCNDCHTPNYPEKAGAVPEAEWLTGSPVGFQGPWGTTYPTNLRILMSGMTEAQWVKRAREPMRPPMPWFALRDMTDGDVRAMHRFVKSLGPAGKPAPAYVPPGEKPATPVIAFPPPPPAR